ncbi:MAG: iron-containing alcohol dehydrogenase, partial [Lachnospiraceae bacterium]|nr:iron-containing alcohol dehydrogenase [Lachnospiraceae bacterium]
SLKDAGVEYKEFGGAQPNPTLSHAEEGVKEAVSFGADMIIGVGGGSAIDTAKGIAHGAANPGTPLWDIWTKKVPLNKSLPVGAVLTMPAAGSEMSDSAVLTNETVGKKSGINTDFNRCAFAIVNPELGMTLPKYQLAAGVTDIMMHTMERYFIPDSDCDLTDEIAEGLLRTVIKNGALLLEAPNDYHAMSEVFWASSLSHNNLTECGRGKDFSVHKLGHALSLRFGVTHGASLAAVWGSWAEELYQECLPRFARFARKVWNVKESDDKAAAKAGIDKTVEFFTSIGMPVSLSGLNIKVSDEDIRELALDATMKDTVKLSRIRPLDAAAVEKIYRRAM